MKIPDWLPVFGDMSFRGKCPVESVEQVTFFNHLQKVYPELAAVAIHPKNEAKRKGKDFARLSWDKANGFVSGASDIIIPTGFVCELKRQDHTKCNWQPGQIEYLKAVQDLGGFACVAFGYKAAIQAIEHWKKHSNI